VADETVSTPAKKARKRRRSFCVLLVDKDDHSRSVFASATETGSPRRIDLLHAGNVTEARQQLSKRQVDLLIVSNELSRGNGLRLVEDTARREAPTQVIVLAAGPTLDDAVAAMRAGATDLIAKPLCADEIRQRLFDAFDRCEAQRKLHERVKRLRRACRKLSAARKEVTDQVDILSNDLVAAYQELADQMHHVVETSEYAALLRKELDLERLLHQTLEFILEKVGPTNAAVFLPVTADEYTLGGYVNYDCADGSPELLLNHLADVVAPVVAEEEAAYHITDNDTLNDWLGDDAAYLTDCHVIATPCWAEGEALAVIVLFRDGSQPFADDAVTMMTAIAPMLGHYLAKVIRVHHRHVQD